jgi:hypothetical protein
LRNADETGPGRAGRCFAPVLAGLLFCGWVWAVPAEAPALSEADRALPTPAELGADWFWPWDTPRQFTYADALEEELGGSGAPMGEQEWRRSMWQKLDPRPALYSMKWQIEDLGEEEFKQAFAALGAMFGFLSEEGGAVGAELSAGGAVGEGMEELVAHEAFTKENVLAEIQAQLEGFLDWGYAGYSRARPNGRPSEIEGYVEHDSDDLSLDLRVYSAEYADRRRVIVDLGEAGLRQAVEVQRKAKEQVKKGLDREAESLIEDYERLMEEVTFAQERIEELEGSRAAYAPTLIESEQRLIQDREKQAAEIEKALWRMDSYQATVGGAMLEGTDGGYMLWSRVSDGEQDEIAISGKMRRGSAILEFSRVAQGQFIDGAMEDTQRILNLVAGKIDRMLNESSLPGVMVASLPEQRRTPEHPVDTGGSVGDGADSGTGHPEPPPSDDLPRTSRPRVPPPGPDAVPEVPAGDRPEPHLLAARLAELGYYKQTSDKLDPVALKQALQAFQRDIGVKATGTLDAKSRGLLAKVRLSGERKVLAARAGSGEHAPRLVAALLAEVGYYRAPPKQLDAEALRKALTDFQEDIGVAASGTLDAETWTKLSTVKLSGWRKEWAAGLSGRALP